MTDDGLWAEGSFIQSMSKDDEKAKTMHKKHDEDMNYNCRKCSRKISAHNKDWHDCLCDDCFSKAHFSEDEIK